MSIIISRTGVLLGEAERVPPTPTPAPTTGFTSGEWTPTFSDQLINDDMSITGAKAGTFSDTKAVWMRQIHVAFFQVECLYTLGTQKVITEIDFNMSMPTQTALGKAPTSVRGGVLQLWQRASARTIAIGGSNQGVFGGGDISGISPFTTINVRWGWDNTDRVDKRFLIWGIIDF